MSDPVARSDELDHQLASESPIVAQLIRIGNQNRTYIKWLSILFGVVAGLLVAVVLLAIKANDNAHAAKDAATVAGSAATQARNVCVTINTLDAQQIDLWNYVLELSSASVPPSETPAERAQRVHVTALFRAHIAKVFKQHDCTKAARRAVRPSSSAPKPPSPEGAPPPTSSPPAQVSASGPQPAPAPPPRPHHTSRSPRAPPPSHSGSPQPSPSPSPTCSLRHPLRCVPITVAAVADPPSAGGNATRPLLTALAAILAALGVSGVARVLLDVRSADQPTR